MIIPISARKNFTEYVKTPHHPLFDYLRNASSKGLLHYNIGDYKTQKIQPKSAGKSVGQDFYRTNRKSSALPLSQLLNAVRSEIEYKSSANSVAQPLDGDASIKLDDNHELNKEMTFIGMKRTNTQHVEVAQYNLPLQKLKNRDGVADIGK